MAQVFRGPLPVYLIEPRRRVLGPQDLGTAGASHIDKLVSAGLIGGPLEYLPNRWFAAGFCSSDMSTCLTVIWFQEEPFPIPSDQARSQLEAIDWKRHAQEFTP